MPLITRPEVSHLLLGDSSCLLEHSFGGNDDGGRGCGDQIDNHHVGGVVNLVSRLSGT